jgi:hypothetical protein
MQVFHSTHWQPGAIISGMQPITDKRRTPVNPAMTTKVSPAIGAASSYQGDIEKGCNVMPGNLDG